MRIESIQIDTETASQVGLKEIYLSKLGQVVLIAGRNGAGKSRLLRLLSTQIPQLINLKRSYDDFQRQVFTETKSARDIRIAINKSKVDIENLTNQTEKEMVLFRLEAEERRAAAFTRQAHSGTKLLQKLDRFKLIGEGDPFFYVPKDIKLVDPNTFTKQKLQQSAAAVSKNGLDGLSAGTLAAIQLAQDRYFNVIHPLSQASDELRLNTEQNYERLRHIIQQFIGADLKRDSDGDATLFDKPLGQTNLSNGQIVLLQFSVALYAQASSLIDVVLLLDEPENHLHPAALNYVLDRLQKVVTRGQIWIATHSINVLAHFDNPTIYYMEDGALSYAGDIPEKVLAGLLGNEEEREKLANFLSLPFEMSSTRFAYESLLVPEVVMTSGKDPQLQQIQGALRQVREVQGKVRVLDFGAGRGRLIATIKDVEPSIANESSATWLDYVAYDPYPINAAECQANIERVYGPVSDRYFSDLGLLRTRYHDGSFDMVLLTNIFHEIPPQQWTKVLRDIMQLLKPEGFLLIVEDQRLPHGERAHEYGFLLFDTLEFRRLFAIAAQDEEQGLYVVQAERGDRLKAHYFKRELLARITPETKKLALEELQANAKREISRIRTQSEHSLRWSGKSGHGESNFPLSWKQQNQPVNGHEPSTMQPFGPRQSAA